MDDRFHSSSFADTTAADVVSGVYCCVAELVLNQATAVEQRYSMYDSLAVDASLFNYRICRRMCCAWTGYIRVGTCVFPHTIHCSCRPLCSSHLHPSLLSRG